MKFEKVEPTGTAPSPRTWHSSCVLSDGRRILYHGGFNGDEAMNDTFILDTLMCEWSTVSTAFNYVPRAGHTSLLKKDNSGSSKDTVSLVHFIRLGIIGINAI